MELEARGTGCGVCARSTAWRLGYNAFIDESQHGKSSTPRGRSSNASQGARAKEVKTPPKLVDAMWCS
eukprot:413486-Amphidinium_carterae.1